MQVSRSVHSIQNVLPQRRHPLAYQWIVNLAIWHVHQGRYLSWKEDMKKNVQLNISEICIVDRFRLRICNLPDPTALRKSQRASISKDSSRKRYVHRAIS